MFTNFAWFLILEKCRLKTLLLSIETPFMGPDELEEYYHKAYLRKHHYEVYLLSQEATYLSGHLNRMLMPLAAIDLIIHGAVQSISMRVSVSRKDPVLRRNQAWSPWPKRFFAISDKEVLRIEAAWSKYFHIKRDAYGTSDAEVQGPARLFLGDPGFIYYSLEMKHAPIEEDVSSLDEGENLTGMGPEGSS
ncbi:uncharacterized protein KY384_007519 [Bacidia gigantensis]|uniref:uncharacterized protein n=1 Tax=Bacidia gigantensis TaxID=2732470 RepID=UPI001D04E50C|nr:uncharacterized protein KY384_007519 [Bacidia gigantensis]KAG8527367.1 hypothetical protein KY384_007519 [Bacidia gigantensis]